MKRYEKAPNYDHCIQKDSWILTWISKKTEESSYSVWKVRWWDEYFGFKQDLFCIESFTLFYGHRILRHVENRGLHAFDHQVDFDDRTLSSQTECHFRDCHPTNLYTSIFPKCPSHDFMVISGAGLIILVEKCCPDFPSSFPSCSPHHSGGICAWGNPSAKVLKCYKRWSCSHIPLRHLGSSPKANPSGREWLMLNRGSVENMIWKYMIL